MRYKPSELAEALEVSKLKIYRQWIPAGAPHTRDDKGNIWIVGDELRDWMRAQSARRKGERMPDDHGYCFKCRAGRKIKNAREREVGRVIMLHGECEVCGAEVYRTQRGKGGVN
jgi:hypothetical protein